MKLVGDEEDDVEEDSEDDELSGLLLADASNIQQWWWSKLRVEFQLYSTLSIFHETKMLASAIAFSGISDAKIFFYFFHCVFRLTRGRVSQ
jgi:hypothetical protein